MNLQKPPGGIEWTRVYGRPGYTANPIKGCQHDCRWRMPDGQVAQCYAKSVAEGVARASYPKGFEYVQFNPAELDAIRALREPAGIFIDSMSDLMGRDVPDAWIKSVIDTMMFSPQHIFFVLTKNPPRLKDFAWPCNAWVGVSAPPTFMFGRELNQSQQERWYDVALGVLADIHVPVRWTSIEPLSWDCSEILVEHRDHLEWAVIGAASNGLQRHLPDRWVLRNVLDALEGIPVFFKGNLRGMGFPEWREENPPEGSTTVLVTPAEAAGQMRLL